MNVKHAGQLVAAGAAVAAVASWEVPWLSGFASFLGSVVVVALWISCAAGLVTFAAIFLFEATAPLIESLRGWVFGKSRRL